MKRAYYPFQLSSLRQLVRFAGVVALAAGVSAVAIPAAAAGASTSPPGASAIVATPPPPPAGSSTAVWQAWASQYDAAMEATPWASLLTGNGCTVSTVGFPQQVSTGASGIPAGITVVAASIAGTCPPGEMAPVPGQGFTAAPDVSGTPNCGGVGGPGTSCVYAPGGDIEAYYQYSGSSSITGHVELTDDGYQAQSCSVGGFVADGTTTTLGSGGFEAAEAAEAVSSVWNSNFWQGASSPYHNEGNVCAYH